MPIDDNIKDLEQEILDRVGYLERDTTRELAVLVSDINRELKAGNFKDRTGNLRRSMRAKLIGSKLEIKMLNYGYFLSFGVAGKNRNNTLGVTYEVARAFGVLEGHRFGSGKVWGIDARKFYPLDIEEKLLQILTEENG